MGEISIVVMSTPPDGFRWQLIERGKDAAIKSGTASTQDEARAAAQKALSELSRGAS